MDKIKLLLKFIWFIIKYLFKQIARIKKILILIFIPIFVIVGGTALVDGIRFKMDKEPIFVVKSVEESPLKITYTGLGYKIIRFPMVSKYEPYENYVDARFGTCFMKFEYEDIEYKHELFDIVDVSVMENIPVEEGIETFYEDDEYIYQFSGKRSMFVVAHFKDREEIPVTEALKNGDIKISDLDEWNIDYIKTKK